MKLRGLKELFFYPSYFLFGQLLPLRPDVLGRLFIAHRAHLILPTHRALDAASEAAKGEEKMSSKKMKMSPMAAKKSMSKKKM